jgi:hypothetical protein
VELAERLADGPLQILSARQWANVHGLLPGECTPASGENLHLVDALGDPDSVTTQWRSILGDPT